MKYRVLITGMRYQCMDEMSLRDTMDHLENDKPVLCLIRKTTHAFGVVVEAKEIRRVYGMVSRFDILDVLELMRRKGFSTLKGKVVSVCRDGGWFIVEMDAPDDFVSQRGTTPVCWARWKQPEIPLMLDIPGHDDVESSLAYLDAALHCPDEFDVETTVDYLTNLIETTRYDVTRETQMALKEFRWLVDTSADHRINSMTDSLIHAINDIGGSERQDELEDTFYQKIVDSDEAADMINAWYSSFAYTKADDMTLEDIRRSKLREIEHSLQTLPDDLYREVDRKGRLLHILLYKDIPYERYRALLSALVMRDHLLDELETVIEYDDVEAISADTGNPLDTAEASQLWTIAQQEGWVDDNRQPTMKSQQKAAILASVMADILMMSPRWEPFELLWGIKDLATKFSKAQNYGYYADTMKIMRKVLG